MASEEVYEYICARVRNIYLDNKADYIGPPDELIDWLTNWWIVTYGEQSRIPDTKEVLHGMCNYLAGER